MGNIATQQSGVSGLLAARNRALNAPAGQAAPTIADLVRGVGNNLMGRDLAMANQQPLSYGAVPHPMMTPGPAAPAPSSYPQVGVGDIMRSIQQAQSSAAPGLSSAPDIASIIRQIRLAQGLG
jgi:hypothetical protein